MRIDAIDVIHYHPFVFANALPHVRSFASFRFRVYPFRQISISTVDIFRNSLFEPRLLFQYPDATKSAIDADITKVGDKYHMFYVAHDGTPGIKQAVSKYINRGYTYLPEWVDPEPKACEAPNMWKRIGEDKWVVMYDIYGINPHNFGFSETTDFVNFKDLGHFNEGVMKATNFSSPKHGAVIHITKKEAEKLRKYWKNK